MTEQKIIDAEDFVGAVKINTIWRIFFLDRFLWILDLKKYLPPDIPIDEESIRKKFPIVDSYDAGQYFNSLKDYEIKLEEVSSIKVFVSENEPLATLHITYLVNFDDKLFVDGYEDYITICQYVPSEWHGITDNPLNYLPSEIKQFFE